MGGADVPAIGFRVLEQENVSVAKVVKVDELHRVEDGVVRLVPCESGSVLA